MHEAQQEQYDVALSFAGEDRAYVEQVARALKAEGIRTFYDAFERDDLWGKDLYVHLDDVYRKASNYCVMFISAAYASKLWTGHERRSIQAKDFVSNAEGNVLPARFDDTELPGLRPQIGYIDLRRTSPQELAQLIGSKVHGRHAQAFKRALAVAIDLSKKYLEPQPVVRSDQIAEEIRKAFRETGYELSKDRLLPYIRADTPAERVVGYIAYQTTPFMWFGDELLRAIEHEIGFAEASGETRPLWQLLVAVALFATVTNPEELQFLRFDLRVLLARLEECARVDPDGQCKEKMHGLIATYSWMRGQSW